MIRFHRVLKLVNINFNLDYGGRFEIAGNRKFRLDLIDFTDFITIFSYYNLYRKRYCKGRHLYPLCQAYRPSADCGWVKHRADKRGKVAKIKLPKHLGQKN